MEPVLGLAGALQRADRSDLCGQRHLATGVTIVVGSTKSETATPDASAFDILREAAKYVAPASPINF